MAKKHYLRLKKNAWVDSKQVGQHDSKVWLTFKPMYVGPKLIVQGGKGGKGGNAYNSIISELNAKINTLGALPPLPPLHPSDIQEEVV